MTKANDNSQLNSQHWAIGKSFKFSTDITKLIQVLGCVLTKEIVPLLSKHCIYGISRRLDDDCNCGCVVESNTRIEDTDEGFVHSSPITVYTVEYLSEHLESARIKGFEVENRDDSRRGAKRRNLLCVGAGANNTIDYVH